MCKKLRFAVALILGAILVSFLTTPTIQAQTFSEWEEIGPAGIKPNSIIVKHPDDHQYAYLVTGEDIYVTENSGLEWELKYSGIKTMRGNRRGENFFKKFRFDEKKVFYLAGKEILVSQNKGRDWESIYQDEEYIAINIDPVHSENIIAENSGGLYRSEDGGVNWSELSDNLEYWDPDYGDSGPYRYGDYYEFYTNPYFDSTIVAQRFRMSGDILYAIGTFISLDLGTSWDSTGNKVDLESVSPEYYLHRIYFNPEDSLTFYIHSGELRKTKDGGKTWKIISEQLQGNTTEENKSNRKLLHSFKIDKKDPNILYSIVDQSDSLSEVYKSIDEGDNWDMVDTYDPRFEEIPWESIPYFNEYDYRVTDTNIFFTSDHGKTWGDITRGINLSMVDFVMSGKNGAIYLKVRNKGLVNYQSPYEWNSIEPDAFKTYSQLLISKSSGVIYRPYREDAEGGGNIFSLLVSHDQGRSWKQINKGSSYFVYEPSIAVDDKTMLAYSYSKDQNSNYSIPIMIRSDDLGKTWNTIPNENIEIDHKIDGFGAPGFDHESTENAYVVITVNDSVDSQFDYSYNLVQTRDGGDTWRNLLKLGYDEIASFNYRYYINPKDPENIFVQKKRILLISEDWGETWVASDSIDGNFVDIEFDPKNHEVMYALGKNKIYISHDRGFTWSQFPEQIECCLKDIAVVRNSLSETEIYAASSNQGVLKLTISGIPTSNETEESSPKTFSLSQNYPNPFNPSTTINYTLEQAGKVNLSVFNTIGQKVYTAVDEVRNAGSYSANIDLRTLSSGVYFYTLTSGEFTETRKMVLLK